MAETVSKPVSKEEPKAARPSAAPAPAAESWHPLENLRRQIDRLFDDVGGFGRRRLPSPFGGLGFDLEPFWQQPGWSSLPAIDIVEHEREYEVSAELPGLDEKDIEVSLSEGTLVIRGEKKEQKEDKKKDYFLSERRYGSFERSFRVPAEVDAEKIEASFNKGVLSLKLPKKAEAQKAEKKISIKAG